jgi:hypothetical protein
MKKRLELMLAVRVSVSLHRKFAKKALPHGGMSAVLRELVEAFVDDRVTISPPPVKEIYHVN